MKIAVNARLLIKNKLEGIGWFSYETLKRITKAHPEHEFIFVFDRKYHEEFIFSDNITPIIAYPPSRHPVLWYLFFEYGIRFALRNKKIDSFFSPDGWIPLSNKVPTLNVVHDLNFLHYPHFVAPAPRRYYNSFFPKFISRSDRIATVSEFTKHDIHSWTGYDLSKIDVVYNGANIGYKKLTLKETTQIKEKYSHGKEYFLFVGLIHPRKNLANMILAYSDYRENNDTDVKFLIVGDAKWKPADVDEAYENSKYKEDIIFLGRVQIDELKNIVGSALCMMYVSFFEGFGIPIIESFNCSVPVITSNVSSMPEVGGDAAIYVDPGSVNDISSAMSKVSKDEILRHELIRKGEIQKQKFSWDITANKLWESMEKAFNLIHL